MINENLKQFLGEHQNLPIQEAQIFTFQLASNDYFFFKHLLPTIEISHSRQRKAKSCIQLFSRHL